LLDIFFRKLAQLLRHLEGLVLVHKFSPLDQLRGRLRTSVGFPRPTL
jgi:hypothetical protein